ncbi:LPXTG cell wall anchor domain-containing protein [Microbulbifer thermotolerans]|uniref:LPXTG cell wall anchor domain-containing protein n=1 Tax=Microbulbifer thermotolerans TaxID=252514 RepID=A0AB35HU16_MICTH|nr:FimV/HubP family polar landmark protein [Microbulbifer thermotolerans]MCX2778898.1 LPXTG cell wall anchor domain-containing protein [Microbulbifer thermotolerans]MCX2784292.1 LPXTG cell wall anchor domain-containing protein [Microbulbifer thermotolerans]MCX2800967.1 LPXTG cell wall anchor domain-containing protein [Microbulbifer thermotolerans]MCX2804203.1 LPXTG cell wall anchor domain-containing protein [Microbulbifer thermotolerans]SFB72602.1 pilus assembly protein FimV [Microbulbifer the
MRVRKLALAVGLVSALGGNLALALGLGEIKLNSTLNQPLNAEISLLQTRGLDDNEIKVRLASAEDFERAGIDRSYLLTELRFDVDYSGGQPVIRITSRTPIREPYLNFLVETRWPSGRLLREYTLLMDLPAFSDTAAKRPVRAAERERQQVRRTPSAPRPQQAPTTRSAPAEPQATMEEPSATAPMAVDESPMADDGSRVYGPVAANETLWEIAAQNRVGREFSVQQTMLAIQRLNPEAFINNNINLLKKGAVLRLPEAADIRAFGMREAISEVAVQNASWRQRIGDEVATGAPLDARAAVDETAVSDIPEGRVTLAAPGDNESVLSGSGSGTEDSEALSGELTVAEEELDKSRLENEELQERIAELDEQIDTMERLVEVSNEELAAVQTAAEQSEPALDPMAIDEEGAESAEEDASTGEWDSAETAGEDMAAEETVVEAASEELVAEPEAPAPQEDNKRNRVVVVQTSAEPTLMERLMDNIMLLAAGAIVLLAGLFGFFTWRRRKEEEEAMLQVEREMAAERALAEAPEASPDKDETLAAVENLESDENFDFGGLDEVGTDDPISEAEIHLSLGQYDEAEGKLLAGLEQDGQNVDARLMLLEVYAHKQDVAKFDDHYRQLLRISDGPAADRAARLRESIADAPPFEAPEMDFSSESLEAAQLDDISASFEDDFGSVESEASAATESAELEASLEDDSALLDDLTLDLAEDNAADGQQETELSLDLDTDIGGEAQAGEAEEDAFNLDDLDLGELDLDTDKNLGITDDGEQSGELGPIEYESTGSEEADSSEAPASEASGGLDFDLDLTPMDDGDDSVTETESQIADGQADFEDDAELSLDDLSADLDAMSDELGADLDLDAIDLDDIAGELSPDVAEDTVAPGQGGAAVAGAEEAAGDLAVAEVSGPTGAETAEPVSAGQAVSQASGQEDLGDLNFNLESDLDSELNLLEGSDEISTKLELAQAYLDMGDKEGAKDILNEVVQESSGEHKARAEEMLERMA